MSIRGWGWFAVWSVVGVGLLVSVLGMLTIGPFVLFPTLILGAALLAKGSTGPEMAGVLSGAGLALIVIAWNWTESLAECSGTSSSTEVTSNPCAKPWNPVPLGLPGLLLVIGGLVVYLWMARRRPMADPLAGH